VYPALWETCLQYWDAEGNLLGGDSEAAVKLTTTYGTSVKTSVSYGPYVLRGMNPTQLILERNFAWYGYADGKHLGQYQTDQISCLLLQDQAAALMEVAAGTADACVIDITMAYAMTGEGTNYADLAPGISLTEEFYGVSFRKGSDLTAMLNDFMAKLKADGTLQNLARKYNLTLTD
jgi:hypothetical protein